MVSLRKIRVYIQMLPLSFWLIFFLFLPLLILVVISFWDMVEYNLVPNWNLENYRRIIFGRDFVFLKLFFKSILMSVAITLGSLALAYPAAYYISMWGGKNKYTWLFLLMTPFFVSWVILVFGWRMILGYNGLVNYLLMKMGLIQQPIKALMYNWEAVIFVLIMGWAPWIVFPLFVSLEKIDKSLLEAAADLGASPIQTFLKVTLPLSMPGVFVATLFVLVPAFGEFVTPILVGGSSGAMYGLAIEYSFKGSMKWPLGSALSLFLMVISIIVISILFRKVGLRRLMESL